MKEIIVFFMLSVCITTTLYADKIYMKNGKVVEGKIIQVTEEGIEYDPVGSVPFEIIAKKQVEKISYDDGRVMLFTEKKSLDFRVLNGKDISPKKDPSADMIFLRGGIIIEGKILKITKDYIQYDPPGARMDDIIMRKSVYQVQMSNGRIIKMDE